MYLGVADTRSVIFGLISPSTSSSARSVSLPMCSSSMITTILRPTSCVSLMKLSKVSPRSFSRRNFLLSLLFSFDFLPVYEEDIILVESSTRQIIEIDQI